MHVETQAMPFARGDDSYLSTKAWDTRLPGVYAELKYWLESPIIGQGFGTTPSIEQGPDGNLYVVSITDGVIYRISRQPS